MRRCCDSADSQSTGLQRERYLWLAVSLKRVTALLQAAAMVLLLLLLLSPDCGKGCGSAVGHSSHPTIVSTSLCWAHLTPPLRCALQMQGAGSDWDLLRWSQNRAAAVSPTPGHSIPGSYIFKTIINNYKHPHT